MWRTSFHLAGMSRVNNLLCDSIIFVILRLHNVILWFDTWAAYVKFLRVYLLCLFISYSVTNGHNYNIMSCVLFIV